MESPESQLYQFYHHPRVGKISELQSPVQAFLICHVQLFKPPEISLTRPRLFDPCNFLNWKSSVWTCFHCLPVSNNTGVIQTKSHPRHPPTHHSTSAIKFPQILQAVRIFMTAPEKFSSLTLTNHRYQWLVTIEKPPGPIQWLPVQKPSLNHWVQW